MFQDNPLLAQLKQQIHDSKEHVEGVVKSTDKAYGFLECDKKSYFIAPPAMKKSCTATKLKPPLKSKAIKSKLNLKN
ncbi:MAG: exoribonuclease II [Haemophilus parainfluenzae]